MTFVLWCGEYDADVRITSQFCTACYAVGTGGNDKDEGEE